MNRKLIGGLLAGLFSSIAVAGPTADFALAPYPAGLSRPSALPVTSAQEALAASDRGAVSAADGGLVRVGGAKRPPPSCGCIPHPRKSCPDRFCNPT